MSALRAVATIATSAAAAAAARSVLDRRPPGGAARWARTNHRGEPVTLLSGPSYAVGAACGALVAQAPPRVRAAGVLAVVGAAAAGALDDLSGDSTRKGLRGHLGALAGGTVTTGLVKIGAIGLTGLAAAATVHSGRRDGAARSLAAAGVDGALVAGTANLLNLLDLRPGRALKATLLTAPAAGPLGLAAAGAAGALLPEDLGERAMLGDTGANAAGALLGVGLVERLGPRGRLGALAAVVALTLASERVSFTQVIESTPGLRELDALGRRPR